LVKEEDIVRSGAIWHATILGESQEHTFIQSRLVHANNRRGGAFERCFDRGRRERFRRLDG
jgi:hypothetical protein